ncbi:tetratricopeptide repeat protein [Treponema sp.]|uniref:tetratricopeptide repeat protein n=1 Tax=Treponema sp. TaxID=166 RepID=UPI003EFE5E70
MNLTSVIIIGVLIAFVATAFIFLIKNIITPSKIDGIPKLIKDGRLQAAQRCAKSVITKNPRNFVAHYYLGKAYLKDEKPELAFIEYKTVNQNALFNGEIPEALFRKEMAELYQRFNQSGEALKEYLLLTKLEPNNPDNTFKAAEILEEQGNTKLAMGFYQKTLLLNKHNPKAYTSVGRLLLRAKNYKQAKQALEMSIKLNPESYENYYYLGKVCKETKELPTAVKLLEKAERSQEFRQKALVEKGVCLLMADQLEKAMDSFERAVANSKIPNSQETLFARYFLGICYEKNRKIEKAIEQWETVYKYNSKFKDVSSKLNQYKELETNDGIKEYLTSNNQQFLELCKTILLSGYNLQCQKSDITPYGCQILATEKKQETFLNAKQQFFLAQFYRSTETMEESQVRKLADTIKEKGYIKGLLFASSDFSHAAQVYADSRPLVLIPKNTLESLFIKAGI